MEITTELEIENQAKVVFHLKILKKTGIVEQDREEFFSLTKEGKRTVECLRTLENYLGK